MMRIQVVNLSKMYPHGDHDVAVLRGINLTIGEASLVSLTGASGVGKSTLLHVLGTLDAPTSGQILYNGDDLAIRSSADTAWFRNQNIGFVFQFHHLLPEFSALENVKIPLRIRREDDSSASSKAEAMLAKVGLSHRLDHKPGELSGGEQQRVALARALVTDPKLLLADEPTGNLDEKTSDGIMDLIYSINRDHKITVVLVTHNTRLAERAQRKLVLTKDGITET